MNPSVLLAVPIGVSIFRFETAQCLLYFAYFANTIATFEPPCFRFVSLAAAVGIVLRRA